MMRKIETLSVYPPADQIFSRMRQKEEAVFLDSSSRGELGQYSILACRPYLRLEQQDGVCRVNGRLFCIPEAVSERKPGRKRNRASVGIRCGGLFFL